MRSNRKIVCLAGFMAAGKTTVGEKLAQRLGWLFIDLDEEIESFERKTAAEIFDRAGEEAFRTAETSALDRILRAQRGPMVLALGGGTLSRDENKSLLREAGAVTIYLSASPEELWARASATGDSHRPLAKDRQTFLRLHEARLAQFRAADFELSTAAKKIDATAREVESIMKSEGLT